MNILIVGGGGREHAIAIAVAKSRWTQKLYCAPGNAGIAQIAQCVPVKATDIDGIVKFASGNAIDLVIVAPDDPLGQGMVDALNASGIRAFGPCKKAAQIESSKVFSKNLMRKYNIPTAPYQSFDDASDALNYLECCEYPVYIKADGLAAGKGAIYAANRESAQQTVREIMIQKIFGDSGSSIVIEGMLYGVEASAHVFTDGETIRSIPSAKDYKKVLDGDRGPNTGGMGAICPNPHYTPEMAQYCMRHIIQPTVAAMNSEGRKFKGVLYVGLMLHPDTNTASVVEYNSRFGDPETQVMLPLLKTDIIDIMQAIIDERLCDVDIQWDTAAAATVIAASSGYPEKYAVGKAIHGLSEIKSDDNNYIVHAGTKSVDGEIFTSGGRVLGAVSKSHDVASALQNAYAMLGNIKFDGMFYRKDIGK